MLKFIFDLFLLDPYKQFINTFDLVALLDRLFRGDGS